MQGYIKCIHTNINMYLKEIKNIIATRQVIDIDNCEIDNCEYRKLLELFETKHHDY